MTRIRLAEVLHRTGRDDAAAEQLRLAEQFDASIAPQVRQMLAEWQSPRKAGKR